MQTIVSLILPSHFNTILKGTGLICKVLRSFFLEIFGAFWKEESRFPMTITQNKSLHSARNVVVCNHQILAPLTMRNLLLIFLLAHALANCKPPSLGNLCDPISKENWETKFLINALSLRVGGSSCFSNLSSTSLTNATTERLNITPRFPSGKMLKRTSDLEFEFDQIVNLDKCTFTLAISNDSFTKKIDRLSTTTSKLTLTPVSGWVSGIERDLGIYCKADNGNETLNPYQIKYSFADAYRYVTTTGNDANSGLTEAAPMATLASGISNLSSSGECSSSGNVCYVLVGKGEYTIASTITPINRISLLGGYETDFLTRNGDPFATNYTPSILTDTRSSTGGGISTPITTFSITGSVNKTSTEISGFHIKPPTGGTGFSSAVAYTSITDSGIRFQSNKIEIQNPGFAMGIYTDAANSGDLTSNLIMQSGTYTGNSWNGIYINATGEGFANIESNTITQGTCSGTSCIANGIATNSLGAATLITKNTINLGNATATGSSLNGFFPFCSNSTPAMTFSQNTIKGTSCTGSGCKVNGLQLSVAALTSKMTISSNDINPGACTVGSCETRGIYITGTNGLDLDIVSNTIYGGDSTATSSGSTFGLLMNTGTSSFINFQNNRIYTGSSHSGAGIATGLRIGATGGSGIKSNHVSGGTGNLVFALWGTPSSNIIIQQNIFVGGTSNSAGNATVDINLGNRFLSNLVIAGRELTGPNAALKISGGSGQVYQNTIIGRGTGTVAYGLEFSAVNTVDIGHNLIVTETGATNRYCVGEDAAAHGPQSFLDNALFDCPAGYYLDQSTTNPAKSNWCNVGGGTFSIASCVDQIASPAGTNNLSPIDPIFYDAANSKYCFSSSSPAGITNGTANNLTTTDLNGLARPTGNRAYGAYEPGSTCN